MTETLNYDTSELHNLKSTTLFPMGSSGLSILPLQLTVEKLNGKFFCEWAQPIRLILNGNGKLDYLTRVTLKPT